MFTAVHLQSDALNWFESILNNYLNNIMSEREDVINKIFTDYKIFKNKIKVVFETINEECTAKREISSLH